MPRTEEQLLDVIYERSSQITRRRRMRVVGIVGASLAVLAIMAYVALPQPGSRDALIKPADAPPTAEPTTKPAVPQAGETARRAPERTATPVDARSEPKEGVAPKKATGPCDPLISD